MSRHGKSGSSVGVGGLVTGTNLRLIDIFAVLAPPVAAAEPEDLSWEDRALCAEVGPELFFPERGEPTSDAKRVCAACEVRAECLDFALRTHQAFGVWGGTSEFERRRLRRQAA